MTEIDQEMWQEWASLELDEELSAKDRAELERAASRDPRVARERAEFARLAGVLRSEDLPATVGFRQQVMRALPPAGWEARHPRSWKVAVALLFILGGLSAALVGVGSAQLTPAGPFVGALTTLLESFRAAALAGAGLLAASWKGLGLALGAALSGSWVGKLALGFFVVSINGMFFLLWRGVGRTAAVAGRTAPRR